MIKILHLKSHRNEELFTHGALLCSPPSLASPPHMMWCSYSGPVAPLCSDSCRMLQRIPCSRHCARTRDAAGGADTEWIHILQRGIFSAGSFSIFTPLPPPPLHSPHQQVLSGPPSLLPAGCTLCNGLAQTAAKAAACWMAMAGLPFPAPAPPVLAVKHVTSVSAGPEVAVC